MHPLFPLSRHDYTCIYLSNSHCFVSYAVADKHAVFWSFIQFGRVSFKLNNLPMHPLFPLSRHDHTCIYLPLTTDITIYVDVELDPDPLIAQYSAHYLSLSQADCIVKLNILMLYMVTFHLYLLLIILYIIVMIFCIFALSIWIFVYGYEINLGIGNIMEKELVIFWRWKKPMELWIFHQLSADEHLWTVIC